MTAVSEVHDPNPSTRRIRQRRGSSERWEAVRPDGAGRPDAPAPELPSWMAEPGRAPAAAAEPAGVGVPSAVRLEISRGGEAIARRLCEEAQLTIGRDPSCGLCLDDPTVSRRHALLERTPGGWVVRDLRSTNGVRVNGRTALERVLEVRDEISVGAFTLEVSFPTDSGKLLLPPPGRGLVPPAAPPAPAPPPAPASPEPAPSPGPSPAAAIRRPSLRRRLDEVRAPEPAAPSQPELPVAAPVARSASPTPEEVVFGRTITLPPGRVDVELRERSVPQRAYLRALEGAQRAGIKVCQLVLDRDVFLLGGGDEAHLRLASPLVPRIAAVIVRGWGGWSLVQVAPWPWVTRLNGRPVEEREWLEEGDQLQLPGGLRVSFHLGIP